MKYTRVTLISYRFNRLLQLRCCNADKLDEVVSLKEIFLFSILVTTTYPRQDEYSKDRTALPRTGTTARSHHGSYSTYMSGRSEGESVRRPNWRCEAILYSRCFCLYWLELTSSLSLSLSLSRLPASSSPGRHISHSIRTFCWILFIFSDTHSHLHHLYKESSNKECSLSSGLNEWSTVFQCQGFLYQFGVIWLFLWTLSLPVSLSNSWYWEVVIVLLESLQSGKPNLENRPPLSDKREHIWCCIEWRGAIISNNKDIRKTLERFEERRAKHIYECKSPSQSSGTFLSHIQSVLRETPSWSLYNFLFSSFFLAWKCQAPF